MARDLDTLHQWCQEMADLNLNGTSSNGTKEQKIDTQGFN
jgi:hypothetical protein